MKSVTAGTASRERSTSPCAWRSCSNHLWERAAISLDMRHLLLGSGRGPDLPLLLAGLAPVLGLLGLRLPLLGACRDLLPAAERVVPAAAPGAVPGRFARVHPCPPPASISARILQAAWGAGSQGLTPGHGQPRVP